MVAARLLLLVLSGEAALHALGGELRGSGGARGASASADASFDLGKNVDGGGVGAGAAAGAASSAVEPRPPAWPLRSGPRTVEAWSRLYDRAWALAQQVPGDLAAEKVQAIPFLDPPADGDPNATGLVYNEQNAILSASPDAEKTNATWLKWYPRLGLLQKGFKAELLGRPEPWRADLWGFNASEVQPPLPPVEDWPEDAKTITGYAFGGSTPTDADDQPQRLFCEGSAYCRVSPFNGSFGTSWRLATNCLTQCTTQEEVDDTPRVTETSITEIGQNDSSITAVHLLQSRRYTGVLALRHVEDSPGTSRVHVHSVFVMRRHLEVCPTCPVFSLGPALSSMFWRKSGESLPCACGGAFSEGDHIVLVRNVSASEQGVGFGGALAAGSSGLVLAAKRDVEDDGDLVLVQWNNWSLGHGGQCTSADCGNCSEWGSSRRWLRCEDIRRVQGVPNGGAAHDATDIVFTGSSGSNEHTPLTNPDGGEGETCTRFFDGPVRRFGLAQTQRNMTSYSEAPVGYEKRPSIIFEDLNVRRESGMELQTRGMVWIEGTTSEYMDNVAAGVVLAENVSVSRARGEDGIEISYSLLSSIEEIDLGLERQPSASVSYGNGVAQCGSIPSRRAAATTPLASAAAPRALSLLLLGASSLGLTLQLLLYAGVCW